MKNGTVLFVSPDEKDAEGAFVVLMRGGEVCSLLNLTLTMWIANDLDTPLSGEDFSETPPLVSQMLALADQDISVCSKWLEKATVVGELSEKGLAKVRAARASAWESVDALSMLQYYEATSVQSEIPADVIAAGVEAGVRLLPQSSTIDERNETTRPFVELLYQGQPSPF